MKVLAVLLSLCALVVVLSEFGILQLIEELWDEWKRAQGGRP